MSLDNIDIKNEDFSKKKSFPKEILQEILKKHLNNRLTKLEESANEHITNLNYTSKYFNEFTKAINQFSKFFEDLKASKEKENDKKHNLESNSTVKFEAKKSNESNKNNTKFTQIKNKNDNTLRTRSNTMGLYKIQQMKRQATNINLARGIFSSRILDEQKSIRQKQNNIISPDEDIKNKTMYIKNPGITDTPKTMRKMGSFIEKNSENSKIPKTEKRVKKNVGTNKKVKSNKKNQTNNITKHQIENERYLTETNEEKNGTAKKNDKKNKKSEIKSKKDNTLHKRLKTTANLKNNNNFSKTINNDFNKTINVEISNKNPDKMNFKTAISTVKRKKIKFNHDLESSNFTDIQDMIKLVDNVSQNINKLLDNDRLNNNRSLMMSSVDINNLNNTFRLSNYKSTANLFNSHNDNIKSKGGILKKKKENPNISLFKENDEDNIENPKVKDDFIIGGAQLGKYIIRTKTNISKEKEKEEVNNEFNIEAYNEKSETKKLENSIKDTLIEDKKEKTGKNEKEKVKEEEIIGIKNFDIIDAFKKNKKLLKNILTYLKDFEIIIFTSCNNYLNKERISFLDNKKEELLQSLSLSKDETMEEKINKIKGEYSEDEITNPPIKFTLSDQAKNKIKELNKDENIEIYKNDLDKNNKDTNIIIITYRILFILLCQEEIYSALNDNIFWKKCGEFLLRNSKGKIGNYILQKVDKFIFTSKSVNKIEYIIKDNKENIINELANNSNIMLIPLIKEAMEYCGIIFSKSKTQGNIIITNLKQNQTIINYLNNLKVRYFLAKYEEDDDD